jgi:predicted Zn-dependent protease
VILSTHPATGERLERLRLEISRHRENWQPLPVDLEPAKRALP